MQRREQELAGSIAAARPGAATRTPVPPHQLLALQSSVGNSAVARLALVQRAAAAPAATRPVVEGPVQPLAGDALIEQMAHGWTYSDDAMDPESPAGRLLEASGYRAEPAIFGANDFQMRLFLPMRFGLPSVVCFRGTEMERGADLATDANPAGVGMDQFLLNVGVIDGALRRAQTRGEGKVVVSGHSLGGALAQIAASWHPQRVSRIVTFQAPGVNFARMQAIVEHNRSVPPGERIGSTHYRVLGDLVPLAGEAMTPGEIQAFVRSEGNGVIANHQAFPLTAAAGRNGSPGLSGETAATFTPMTPTSTNTDNAARTAARVGAGFSPLGRAVRAGAVGAEAIYERYAGYWSQVSAAVDAGRRRPQVEAMIRGWSLWYGFEDHMLRQLDELYRIRATGASSTRGHTSRDLSTLF